MAYALVICSCLMTASPEQKIFSKEGSRSQSLSHPALRAGTQHGTDASQVIKA